MCLYLRMCTHSHIYVSRHVQVPMEARKRTHIPQDPESHRWLVAAQCVFWQLNSGLL